MHKIFPDNMKGFENKTFHINESYLNSCFAESPIELT